MSRIKYVLSLLIFASACSTQAERMVTAEVSDVKHICHRFTDWEKDKVFMALQPGEKQVAVTQLFQTELKSKKFVQRFKFATSAPPDKKVDAIRESFYAYTARDYSCPAFDRSFPPGK